MSESAKPIIRYFCDRFLDIEYYPSDLKSILDLQLNNLKNMKKEELKPQRLKKTKQKYQTIFFSDFFHFPNDPIQKVPIVPKTEAV